ncbi:MAG: DUF4382 domain-containing protein [Dehalococcoidia bacterium]
MRKLFAVFMFLPILVLAACSGTGGEGNQQGQAVFSVSDAAADMGAVSDIELTVDGLRVRNESGAWVDVDVEQETFMLLELRDAAAAGLLADAELDAGTYDRLELQVSNATVIDNEGEHEARIPNNTLELEGMLEVEADSTASADFDFLADQSLHMTSDGEYVFAPVIQLETRSGADVTVDSSNVVQVSGGDVGTQMELGMDVMGNVDAGLRITPDAVLSLSADGRVEQTGGQALVSGIIQAVNTDEGTVTVATRNGGNVTLHLAGDSTIKVNNETKTAAELEAETGSRLNVAYNAATKAIMSAAVGASAEARAEVGARLNVSGVIQSVNEANGTITVLTDAGSEVVLEANESSSINLGGSLLSGLLGLESAIGSRVEADYDASSKTVGSMEAAAEADAAAEASARGTLEAVDRLNGEITVIVEDGNELVLSVPARANVVIEGTIATFGSLAAQAGSEVEVRYNSEANAVTEVRAGGEGSVDASATMTGTLEGVNTLSGTITVAAESGSRTVLSVGSATQVVVGGVVSSVAALSTRIGSEIDVTYNAETNVATAVEASSSGGSSGGGASAGTTVSGTLDAVSALDGTVDVVTESGETITLEVVSQTEILVDGSSAALAGIATEVGSSVVVEYEAETNTATSINIS